MKQFNSSGKRKRAIARANIKAGTGVVKINNRLLEFCQPEIAKLKLQEPLMLASNHTSSVDITVKISGGGTMSQTEAARLAIARALIGFTKDKKLEKAFLEYDRHLLVADVRRREARKPNRHGKARSKRQKSYR